MSVGIFHKAINYMRAVQEIVLFATMADSRWYLAFGVSPLFFIMLPFLGLLFTINSLFNAYYFTQAYNKNLNQWLNLIVSSLCAVLASISLYGAVLSAFWGLSFAAGPWFFFSSLMVAMTHQITLLSLNLYRAYESLSGSTQRMHFIQAALSTLFGLGLLSGILGAVLFVMLFPTVAPAVGVASAISAVTFTVLDLGWRIIPHHWKLATKESLNVGKPEPVKEITVTAAIAEQNPNHYRLFTRFDYSLKVKSMDIDTAKQYLTGLLDGKIASYRTHHAIYDEKTQDKIATLKCLLKTVNSDSERLSKPNLLKEYPLAFQSFFTEVGDVEQLCNAVLAFEEKRSELAFQNIKSVEFSTR